MQEAESQPYDRGEDDYVTHVVRGLRRDQRAEPGVGSLDGAEAEAKARAAREAHLARWRRG